MLCRPQSVWGSFGCLVVMGLPALRIGPVCAGEPDYAGFAPATAKRQAAIEQRIAEIAQAETVGRFARTLGREPHIAGTPAQARTRDYVIDQFKRWGLRTDVAEYEVFLPYPTTIELSRVQPEPQRLDISEPAIANIAPTQPDLPFPPHHGYAAAGDVTAPVVYVNYAREEDLDRLEALGVDLRGKIALARYGRLYRGRKVENVQKRGAVGCIIYSDPREDGYFHGDPYPSGPMRPERGVQRGSVKFGPPGDPTTPGVASLPGAQRISPADSPDLPKIPSTPVSYGVARELLRFLGGPEVPQQDWQGALPLRYHVGPGPAVARLHIEREDRTRAIWDTFGRIEGSEFPDEWILIGGHRDAWCDGAADNVAGSAIVMETARICAELARAGQRPRRTLIFATWDAEEWGIIGSNEWVEQHRDELAEHLVAYINQDMSVTGPNFGGSASPTLATLLTDVTRVVPDPDGEGRLYARWAGEDDQPPGVGVPSGGSDHGPFFLHMGIACVNYGFGGRGGIYHSRYDTADWMERFGDPGYKRHRANAIIAATLLMRLANADLLAYDFSRYADKLTKVLDERKEGYEKLGAGEAFAAASTAAADFATASGAWADAVRVTDLSMVKGERLAAINALLRKVEPTLTRYAAGRDDRTRQFYQNLVFGLAAGGGYRQQTLPGIHAAIETGDADRLHEETNLLVRQLRAASTLLDQARTLLAP